MPFTLYPKNSTPSLDPALFQNPTAEYRGTPFWSWNCKLERATLLRQIEVFKQMGLGGAHMHARVGLATDYMGPEFLDLALACVDKFKSEQMLGWLYDEDRWPSGAAGGLVTCDERYRMKHLLFTPVPYAADAKRLGVKPLAERPNRRETGQLLARYAVTLKDGRLASYRRLTDKQRGAKSTTVWYAYLDTQAPSPWYNNQTYADTLSREAMQKFIEVTHERYYAKFPGDFGGAVPAIFTDEPNLGGIGSFKTAASLDDVRIAWTTDFAATYEEAYGADPLDVLPEVFWELPGGAASRWRHAYYDHATERFASAFAGTIGEWCEQHNIALTGHMLSEESLGSQTNAVGEVMRSLGHFQLPGIDLLCDNFEYSTAKQAQSAARQYGRPGVLSELYGVTNWDFTFAGHKRQGDWQAALGITVRVPHLAWVSMGGEAKRDYPAAIDYHSPWWTEYRLVEDHFARLNTALTRGQAVCRVAVVHPIESYWLCRGPQEQTRPERETREQQFRETLDWLLHGLVDFDFISEALLPSQCAKQKGKKLTVGQCAYDVVVVPALRTIRSTTLARLQAFAAAGGEVVFAGEIPSLVDAVPSPKAQQLARKCTCINLTRAALLDAVAPYRELSVLDSEGGPAPGLLYQMRQDGSRRYLFICNTRRDNACPNARVRIRGAWELTELDTATGEIRPRAATQEGGQTVFTYDFAGSGHILLQLDPAKKAAAKSTAQPPRVVWNEVAQLAAPARVALAEPNVLMLDQAQWQVDGGEWQGVEEVLRINQAARRQLGWAPTGGGMAQPWVEPATPPDHTIGLRFAVECRASVCGAKLALEQAAASGIKLDGASIAANPDGWWVDETIATVPLPDLAAGAHVIEVQTPYGRRSSLEWAYLLGDFGVQVRGRRAQIVEPVRELDFSDWVPQGLPFYGGNVTYRVTFDAGPAGGRFKLSAPLFRAPLLQASLDGQGWRPLAFPPYELDLGELAPGQHTLDLLVYGCRINCFGAVHCCDLNLKWYGPSAYRTGGTQWSYEYFLRPQGFLTAPRLLKGK